MVYKKLSNEELTKFKYPNLIAELIESGYSICTLGEHMGLGRCQSENDPEVWNRIKGKTSITMSEAKGLAGLFGVKFEYLFSHELLLVDGKSYAHYRWYEWNKKIENEYETKKALEEICKELKDKPYLLDFIKSALKWNPSEVMLATTLLNSMQ